MDQFNGMILNLFINGLEVGGKSISRKMLNSKKYAAAFWDFCKEDYMRMNSYERC
jgi:hypothetical protein